MDFSARIFLGIDTAGSPRPYSYVGLDDDGRLLVLGQGRLPDLLAFLAGQASALVAVNAPARPLAGDGGQESLFPIPSASAPAHARQAETELEQLGIHPRAAVGGVKLLPRTRNGYALYGYLEQLDFQFYPSLDAPRQVLETHSEAAYRGLAGCAPYDGRSLEGRMQRQAILYQQKLPVSDPMDFLEEVTPRKLAHGLLPLDKIAAPGELDAWMAAWVAWLAGQHPDRLRCLGTPEEGQIYLPVSLT